jgi:hypothetical protein
MTTARLVEIEVNLESIDNLIRNNNKIINLTPALRAKLVWYKELQIQELRALRHIIDEAINDFYRTKNNGND